MIIPTLSAMIIERNNFTCKRLSRLKLFAFGCICNADKRDYINLSSDHFKIALGSTAGAFFTKSQPSAWHAVSTGQLFLDLFSNLLMTRLLFGCGSTIDSLSGFYSHHSLLYLDLIGSKAETILKERVLTVRSKGNRHSDPIRMAISLSNFEQRLFSAVRFYLYPTGAPADHRPQRSTRPGWRRPRHGHRGEHTWACRCHRCPRAWAARC